MYDICLKQDIAPRMCQQQRLLMTTSMQQAIYVMQLPILELSEWIKNEIENNPVLEIQLPEWDTRESFATLKSKKQNGEKFQAKELLENLIPTPISLFDHLMAQARCHFEEPSDLNLAQWIIGHLDEKGFLTTSLEELATFASQEKLKKVLTAIQTFDPPGIGASNLQESLLIQLQFKNKQATAAYRIIASHFEDLLHNRLVKISKQLNLPLEKVSQAIAGDIIPLDLNPGTPFVSHYARIIVPDLFLLCVDETWKIEVNHSFLPDFQLALSYRKAVECLTPDEQAYLRRHLSSGKWLKQIVEKRKMTLLKIGEFILKNQIDFFQGGKLVPLTLSEAATALNLHESTIARAVANKYLSCPQGVFALKDLFSQGLRGDEGSHVSQHTLRLKLKELIANEDKQRPLSDSQIKEHLSASGIPCARRTVAKYRRQLKIAPASRRNRWS
jgi:RNA polymerase sigma-54 factor